MATWKDVERIASALPEVAETLSYHDWRSWKVKGKNVIWERPLSAKDEAELVALGGTVPGGLVVCVRVADLEVKAERIAENSTVVFTIPHFDRSAAILVRLDLMGVEDLKEYIVDAWLHQTPKTVAAKWRAERET